MVTLKLERDQARTLYSWFNYWQMLCDSHISQPGTIENEKFMWQLLKSVINQVNRKFEKRLQGFAVKFRFNFEQSEAITLHEFCKKQPIPADQFYLINLRQQIIDVLHKQLI